jgi:hypothetical protein
LTFLTSIDPGGESYYVIDIPQGGRVEGIFIIRRSSRGFYGDDPVRGQRLYSYDGEDIGGLFKADVLMRCMR